MDRDIILGRLAHPLSTLGQIAEEELAVIADDTGIVAELAELLPVTGPRDWGILHQDEDGGIRLLLYRIRGGAEADIAVSRVCLAYELQAYEAETGARLDRALPDDDLSDEIASALGF